jgi:pimeloyl-ACP methyl ester carboxylesterase
MRVFTAEYPDEVAGLILVDPATEDAYEYWRMNGPDNWNGVEAEVTKNFGEPPAGWYGQWEELPRSIAQARQSWPLPDVPVIVFTAMKPISEEWMLANSERLNVWLKAHEALVQQIPNAEHIVVEDADHGGILEKPVVWQKILEIVEQTRH